MKKVRVTLVKANGELHLQIGSNVNLVYNPDSSIIDKDPHAISVCDENMEKRLGFVAHQYGLTVLDSTLNNTDFFNELEKRELIDTDSSTIIQAVVVDSAQVTFSNGQQKLAFIVEVELPSITETESSDVKFKLTVRGSVKDYPGKTMVLKTIQSGDTMSLHLKKEDGKMITVMKESDTEVKSGLVSKVEEGDSSQLEEYLDALAKRDSSQVVTAIEAKSNTFTVEFSIDKATFLDVLSGKVQKTFEEVKKDILDAGITDLENLKAIESYLKSNKVSEKQIKKVFETMRTYDESIQSRIPNPVVKYKDTDGIVNKSLVYLNTGKHLRLVGEKGVGKNVLIETLAWVYQRPLYEMALNSQTDKMDILGSKTFETEVDENGKEVTKMSFDKEALIQAMEVGGFMNLDEVNAADPSVLVVLHPIADGRGRIEVPGYGLVEADSNFGLLLTMNRDYVGTSPLNEATRDRFIPILFPEVPSIAKMLSVRVPLANPKNINSADKVYGSIMKLVKDGQLTNDCITNRGFIDAMEVSDEIGLLTALTDNVANRIEDDDYRATVVSIIDDIAG